MIIAAGYAIGFGFTLTAVARTCWRMRRRPARAFA
ncbi:hypothetical protein FHY02_000261 [Sphingomonas sp. BK069]|nr:hypothetical protein [Sphingomonas sp. BK069]MBB3474582.1 hypothetical protein [Sphingomonas sp. BK345]